MLETQTQIIGAGCDMPAEERIAWLQIYCDSIVLGKERLQRELDQTKGYISVCLCDNTPSGHTLQYGWEQCSLHDAVKLASMKGKDVLLHVRNERGEIVPVRGEA